MRIAVLFSLVVLCACEAKKSTGTFGKAVPKSSSSSVSEPSIPVFENGSAANKANCELRSTDLDEIPTDATAITVEELVTGDRAFMALRSVETVVSDTTGLTRLIENRLDSRYSQSCKNLMGISAFTLRYAAPRFFSLVDGKFGKLSGRDSEAQTYALRFDPSVENGRARASLGKARLRGTIQKDLVEQLPEFAAAELRFFRFADGDVVIRARRQGPTDSGLVFTWTMRYELKRR